MQSKRSAKGSVKRGPKVAAWQRGSVRAARGAEDTQMHPGLIGTEQPTARYAGRRHSFSVEDPLGDWPDDVTGDEHAWLLAGETERR